ncbi:TPA: hypothetical protein I2T40_14675 [Staphylococcus aureus]|nr:hypothetical protein [Staphylococcus aureus]HAR7074815.1 hypothetical protein [Staphylococcus aureus]
MNHAPSIKLDRIETSVNIKIHHHFLYNTRDLY